MFHQFSKKETKPTMNAIGQLVYYAASPSARGINF